MKATKCDVVVLGAGVMGSSAAWWLARRGLDVVLVERLEQHHERGSSHGATRIFRLAYDDVFHVRMALEALPLWRQLEDEAGEVLLETTAGVDHGPPPAIDRIATALDHEGVRHEILTSQAANERWPGMRFDHAVLAQPDAGRCWADHTVSALQRLAGSNGAELRFGVGRPELRWSRDGSAVTVRAGDCFWRPQVVVATVGAWAADVLSDHVNTDLLTVTLEQVQHFAPSGRLGEATHWPSFLHHRQDDPLVYGLLSPGEGVKVDEHHAGPEIDPELDRRDADEDRRAQVARYVEAWFPGLDPTPVHTATCLYTTTSDEKFALYRQGPIVLGFACSGHGFKFAPLIGRRLADLATNWEG